MANAARMPTVTAESGRVLATRPEAVFVFLFGDDERTLLLRRPGLPGWRPVGGAVEAAESVQEAAMRELREELGEQVRAELLGLVHAWTFRFDDHIRWMTSMAWVASYQDGEPMPGGDMAGSQYAWLDINEVKNLDVSVPEGTDWLLNRALTVYRSHQD